MRLGGRTSYLAALALLAVLAAAALSAPQTAGLTHDLRFDLDRDRFVVDITANRSADHLAAFSGNLTVDVDFSTTVYLTAIAGSWETAITPTEKNVLPGESVVYFSGLCEVPGNAADGTTTLVVRAQGEDPAGTPFWVSETMPIQVIQNRVQVEPGEANHTLPESGNLTFNVQVANRGTTPDTFALSASLGQGMAEEGWEVVLQYEQLAVQPGMSRTVNVALVPPENVTSGSRAFTLSVASSVDTASSYQTQYVVRVDVPGGGGGPAAWWYVYVGLAVGFAVVGFALYVGVTEIGLFAFYAIFILPLYVRLKRDKILSHFTRGQIFGYIQANPGASYSDIMADLGLVNGVLTYHLTVLEREGFVRAQKDFVSKRFYPSGQRLPEQRFRPSRLQKDILQAMLRFPGINQVDLARLLDESKQVIHYHLKVLERERLVRIEQVGRSSRCYAMEVERDEKPSDDAGERAPTMAVVLKD